MAATWEHPKFGKCTYDEIAWVGTIAAPAFDVFTFDNSCARQRAPNGTYRITFDADDENEKPSAEAVAVALAVLTAQDEMPKKLMKAFWDDFNGRGPKSGMWWHGQLGQVVQGSRRLRDLRTKSRARARPSRRA